MLKATRDVAKTLNALNEKNETLENDLEQAKRDIDALYRSGVPKVILFDFYLIIEFFLRLFLFYLHYIIKKSALFITFNLYGYYFLIFYFYQLYLFLYSYLLYINNRLINNRFRTKEAHHQERQERRRGLVNWWNKIKKLEKIKKHNNFLKKFKILKNKF
jgi:hypothetical protein